MKTICSYCKDGLDLSLHKTCPVCGLRDYKTLNKTLLLFLTVFFISAMLLLSYFYTL